MHGRIEKTAILAAVQIGVAAGTLVVLQDFLRGEQGDSMTAVEAGKGDLVHEADFIMKGRHGTGAIRRIDCRMLYCQR